MANAFRIDVRKHREKVDRAIDEGRQADLKALWEPIEFEFDSKVADRIQDYILGENLGTDDLDGWLSPRLHNLLRMPRRLASDPGVWCWFATHTFTDYMKHRWPKKAKSGWWRYQSGDLLRNGVSRLWWGAEMVRNGPDYTLVPSAFADVRTYQNVSELRYSWHRETARAFTRVLIDQEINGDELSVLFNATLATHGLERFDSPHDDSAQQSAWDLTWAADSPSFKELLVDVDKLVGPECGYARAPVEDAIYKWITSIFDEAELQGQA